MPMEADNGASNIDTRTAVDEALIREATETIVECSLLTSIDLASRYPGIAILDVPLPRDLVAALTVSAHLTALA